MARRRSRKAAKSLEPCELDIFLELAQGAGAGFVDIGEILSKLNRKFFRQGMQYVVSEVEMLATGTSTCLVMRLPHYWPAVNSWTKAQALWKQQQDDRLEQSGIEQTIARYRDFKIFMNDSHAQAGTIANLQSRDIITEPAAQVISPSVNSDWEASQIVWSNFGGPGITVERTLHMMGDNGAASVGLIKAYAESRNRPMQTDPNIVDVALGGAFGSMFDVADDSGDIVTNAQEHNDLLPYLNDIGTNEEFYPGGTNSPTTAYQECLLSISATGDRVLGSRSSGFLANCGLLYLLWNASEATTVLRITLAPGNYKGVMARPMQDVN